MNCTSATTVALTQPQRLVLQAALQVQCARVVPVGLRDAAPAATRKVMTAGLSAIAERTPLGTFFKMAYSIMIF